MPDTEKPQLPVHLLPTGDNRVQFAVCVGNEFAFLMSFSIDIGQIGDMKIAALRSNPTILEVAWDVIPTVGQIWNGTKFVDPV